MQHSSFTHRVSKGSRYNQIYVPKEYEKEFENGDIVEVRLLKKQNKLYYSKSLKKLTPFKEKLIKEIFSELKIFKEIKQVFVFGSFLTKKADYNDIDILLVSDKEEIDREVHERLTDKFNLKFHVVSFTKEKLDSQLKKNPLVRSMFYYSISNKNIENLPQAEVDENQIRFLLMFPEDLLEVSLEEGRIYYDVLRKLITMEHFLKRNEIAPDLIDKELKKLIDKKKLEFIKENNSLNEKIQKELELIIKEKIKLIYRLMKNGEKTQYR